MERRRQVLGGVFPDEPEGPGFAREGAPGAQGLHEFAEEEGIPAGPVAQPLAKGAEGRVGPEQRPQ